MGKVSLRQIGVGILLAGISLAYVGQGCAPSGGFSSSIYNGATNPGNSPRVVIAPNNVEDLSQIFVKDHIAKPYDRFYLAVRYQWPNWSDPDSTAFRYPTDYDTHDNTGLGPWSSSFQRGPLGGSGPQSVYQLKGYEVGVLMRSQDSPHPQANGGYPVCAPNCNGYEKHTIYEYQFSQPVLAFTKTTNPSDTDFGLVVDAELQVYQMEGWSSLDGGAPKGILAGQFAWVITFRDPSGKPVQYVIFAFHSRPNSYNGSEAVVLEPIGNGDNGYYITTSFKRSVTKQFVTTVSAEDDFFATPWQGYKKFSAFVSPKNLLNAIEALNAKGAGLSTDVLNYKLSQVGLNQEVHYEDNGDAFVMGSSYRNLSVTERHR